MTATESLADWILERLPATGGDVDFTRLELETRINKEIKPLVEALKEALASSNPEKVIRDALAKVRK